MKHRILALVLTVFGSAFYSCNPISSIQIETIVPAEIEFPGNYNQIVFVNLAKDLNNDNETDTLLYNIITEEMSLGFQDAIKNTVGVDSTSFLYVKGFPDKNKLYKNDTISWDYLVYITKNTNSDIFVILDSLKMSMTSDKFVEYYTVPTEYYQYRELMVSIHWSVFDLVTKERLDRFQYKDTLIWEEVSYIKSELDDKMPSVSRSIREASYFAAADYANRIFPGWKSERRFYFNSGNKDFKKAAEYVKDYQWKEAIPLWEKYIDDIDKEIASRACYNLAFANEMLGKMDLAIAWAKQSKSIKNKSRTRYYIALLESRQKQVNKLEKQIN